MGVGVLHSVNLWSFDGRYVHFVDVYMVLMCSYSGD